MSKTLTLPFQSEKLVELNINVNQKQLLKETINTLRRVSDEKSVKDRLVYT